ncbi:MAG TPA: hypothetical protein VGV61_10430 [Thermoanaerobaculia bacterium]|jgi:hypothetical protein|nr:hypothetical protein [Thermoanaerobaculia bacterium]
MEPQDLLAFVRRDWQAAEAAEADHWIRRKQAAGATEGLRVAAALRQLTVALRPEWPAAADRQADLDHHVRLAEALRRVVLSASG